MKGRCRGNTHNTNILNGLITVRNILLILSISFSAGVAAQHRSEVPVRNYDTKHIAASDSIYINQLLSEAKTQFVVNTDSAMLLLRKALELSLRHDYPDGIFEGFLNLGYVYSNNGDYVNGKLLYEKAASYSSATSIPALSKCRVLNNIGNLYYYLGNYYKAAFYYLQAIEEGISEPAAEMQIANVYSNLAGPLSKFNENDKAFRYLGLAEQIARKRKDTGRLTSVLNNKGVISEVLGNDKYAFQCYNQALALSRQNRSDRSAFPALNGIASILIGNSRPKEALPYLREASMLPLGVYDRATLLYAYSAAYFEMHDYRLSEQTLLKLLAQAQALNHSEFILFAHESLATIYSERKDYRRAFEHHMAFYQLNDTMVNKEKAAAVNQLETKYRTAQKDKLLAEKQLFIQQQGRQLSQKNIWVAGIASGAFLLCGLTIGLYRNYRQKQHLQDKQIRILQQEKEIGQLRASMEGEEKERTRMAQELHDGIGSTIAAVKMDFTAIGNDYSMLRMEPKFGEALNRLDIIYLELRQVAHHLTPEILLQHGLTDSIALYCESIEKGKKLDISFQSHGVLQQISSGLSLTIYRVVQELIHNIVKHSGATQAFVQLYHHEHKICVLVEDNGTGFKPEAVKKGIGLMNLETRMKTVDGLVTIDSSEQNGTSVYLEFNLEDQPKTAKE